MNCNCREKNFKLEILTDFSIDGIILFVESEERLQEFANRLDKVNQGWNLRLNIENPKFMNTDKTQ